MSERRILDAESTEFERELLQGARAYRVSEEARGRTLAAVASSASAPALASPRRGPSFWSSNRRLVTGLVSCGVAVGAIAWRAASEGETAAPVSPASHGSPMALHAPATASAIPAIDDEPPSMDVTALPSVVAPPPSSSALEATLTAASARAKSAKLEAAEVDVEDLAAELASLDETKRTLAAGDTTGALRMLDAHDARFRRGRLVPESTALRVEALLAAGQTTATLALASRFLEDYPTSPVAKRIRALADKAHAMEAEKTH
ncbi:MAG: hypothetical protein BGO98_26210 [Myxococcales bacterium 68-20]|nr:MAG: hypothetical protein BGO98_26210 [Myxococcales bacterium 68-20]